MSDQAAKIAACCLHDPKNLAIQIAQTEHRLKLVSNGRYMLDQVFSKLAVVKATVQRC